jgi:hypothetical protein
MIPNPHFNQINRSQGELTAILEESGLQGVFQNIFQDLSAVSSEAQKLLYKTDVIFYPLLDDINYQKLQTFLNTESEIQLSEIESGRDSHFTKPLAESEIQYHYYSCLFPTPLRLNSLRASYAVVVIGESDISELDGLILLLDEYPYLLVIGNEPALKIAKSMLSNKALVLQMLHWNDIDNHRFADHLSEITIDRHAYIQCITALKQIEKIGLASKILSDQEERSVRSRKALAQQSLNIQQKNKSESTGDFLQKIKSISQQQSLSFEKGIQESCDNFFRANNGELVMKLETFLDGLTELQAVKRSKVDELIIPADFAEELNVALRTEINRKAEYDLKVMVDILSLYAGEIEKQCVQEGVSFSRPNIKYLMPTAVNNLFLNTRAPGRKYSGQTTRKGPYEYFMAARKYQMLFLMVASVFGLGFLKNNTQYTIPLSLVLMGFGGFNVWRTVGREREESNDKEIKKAKETLMDEIKDVAQDFQRQWPRILLDHFKEQIAAISAESEMQAKQFASKNTAQSEEEKKKIARSLQNYEQTERRMEVLTRSKLSWEKTLVRTISDLQTGFSQLNRSERRAGA